MIKEKTNPLKIETFADGEDREFLIDSRMEIQNILQTICKHNSRSAIYYDERKRFYLTMLLAADEQGIWIDPASNPRDNRNILASEEIVFVSTHNQTKVQFAARSPQLGSLQNSDALFLPLPQQLLRLQRRDCYRMSTWPQYPVKCIFKPTAQVMPVVDISVSGLSLEYREKDVKLRAGNIYPDCEIDLPEVGRLTATLQVKNLFEVVSRTGRVNQRAGCEFVKPGRETILPLQRYVAQMQRMSASLGSYR